MNNGIEHYKTELQTFSAVMKSTLSREIEQSFLESIGDLEIDKNIKYSGLIEIFGTPQEFHDAYYEGSLEAISTKGRVRLANLISNARLARPQYNRQYQGVLFFILVIPVIISLLILASSILPYRIRSFIEYYEPEGIYLIVIAYFVISSVSGRIWLTPEKENIYLLLNRITILIGLIFTNFYAAWVSVSSTWVVTLIIIIELIVILRVHTPILVDYLPFKLKARRGYLGPLLLILIFGKYILGARPAYPWYNAELRVEIFKYVLIFLFLITIAINVYELKMLKQKKVEITYIKELSSMHELFPRVQGLWDRVLPTKIKISYIAFTIGIVSLVSSINYLIKSSNWNYFLQEAMTDISIIFAIAFLINIAEDKRFSKKYAGSEILHNHTLLLIISYLLMWLMSDLYSSTATLAYGMIVVSSQEELNFTLALFLFTSILTSVIIPILLINSPKIKEMNFEDKKSSLKFLNGYLIVFSFVMIGLVSFFARLIYYKRGFVDSVGFMVGDIFIGGVLVIQSAVQFIYTRKQLNN